MSETDVTKIEQSTAEIVTKIKNYVGKKKIKGKLSDFELVYRLIFGEIFGIQIAKDPDTVFSLTLGEKALILEISEMVKTKIANGECSIFASSMKCQKDEKMPFYPSTTQTIIGTLFGSSNEQSKKKRKVSPNRVNQTKDKGVNRGNKLGERKLNNASPTVHDIGTDAGNKKNEIIAVKLSIDGVKKILEKSFFMQMKSLLSEHIKATPGELKFMDKCGIPHLADIEKLEFQIDLSENDIAVLSGNNNPRYKYNIKGTVKCYCNKNQSTSGYFRRCGTLDELFPEGKDLCEHLHKSWSIFNVKRHLLSHLKHHIELENHNDSNSKYLLRN